MKWAAVALIVLSLGIIFWGGWWIYRHQESPMVTKIAEIAKPLDKYTIEALGQRQFSSQIFLDEAIATTSAYQVFKFHFDSDGKNITGMAHIPDGDGPFPVVLQLRGYVDPAIYQPGMGTAPSARVYAENGFISLAPDGLGYGGSDNPSSDVFEERFQNYTTSLNLLAAIGKWSLANGEIGLWGHSNGGQQAITVLEISQKPYPTVLWAPVTKPFPYSILYFTDDIPDHGKALRKVTANFEKDYDVEKYSLTNYLDRITAPIQLHQGGIDATVPQKWSDDFYKQLATISSQLSDNYYIYPGAGHMMEGSWDTVVNRDIDFYNKHL